MALIAGAIACIPSAGELLQYDRTQILSGEFWRLATGHLTHWNFEHIQWDLLMFVVLEAVCEMRSPRRMWMCTALSAALVSTVVFFWFPEVTAYRGLSGIDTALFTLLSLDLLRDALRQRTPAMALATGGLLVGFVVKTGYEAATGHAMFVDQHAAGFDLLIWDHIVAGITGAIVAFGMTPSGDSKPGYAWRSEHGTSTSQVNLWNCA
jgi:rhomboid family GlyGly-CTERM serine protease